MGKQHQGLDMYILSKLATSAYRKVEIKRNELKISGAQTTDKVNPFNCHSFFFFLPSLAFHIFNISFRTISLIELKLSGRRGSNMEIQNF